jgi:UDP-2,3-diacylglucosamine pyrophosphatase LpxH
MGSILKAKSQPKKLALLTKHNTDHALAQRLLGNVVALEIRKQGIVLYYQDQHATLLHVDADGDLVIGELVVPRC